MVSGRVRKILETIRGVSSRKGEKKEKKGFLPELNKDFVLEAVGLKKDPLERESLSRDDLKKLVFRSQFSKYIMPAAYDEKEGIYYNQDGSIGFIFECMPLLFAGEQVVNSLASLFNFSYPKGSSIQFILYADPLIDAELHDYCFRKSKAPFYIRKAYYNLALFYKEKLKERLRFPPKNFRLIVCFKLPYKKEVSINEVRELKTAVRETLNAAKLAPSEMRPEIFLFLMRTLLNDFSFRTKDVARELGIDPDEKLSVEDYELIFRRILDKFFIFSRWDKHRTLNRQIIFADTEVDFSSGKELRFGKRKFRCLTFKTLPLFENTGSFLGNLLSGIYSLSDGIAGDAQQIPSPFFINFTVFTDSANFEIQSKANLIMQQQAAGTFIMKLREKIDEYLWAVQLINQGEKFLRCFFTFWVFSEDEDDLRTSLHKYARILESLGASVQEETLISPALFTYSLPMGGVSDKNTFILLDRDFLLPTKSIAACVPDQADFSGTGEMQLMFLGRKGQLVGIDLFSKRTASYNFFVAAPTGKGKSFFVNYIVSNYYGAGAKIRIIDIGASYKKLAKMFGGVFLEFSPDSNLSVNPFGAVYNPRYDVPVITNILVTMATAVTEKLPEEVSTETAYNIMHETVKELIRYADSKNMPYSELSIDNVYEMLMDFMKYFPDAERLCGEEGEACRIDFERVAKHLAFNLRKYTSEGTYGRWFKKENTFNIAKEDFVVLELEHLKSLPDLFKVITLMILNAVTADLYLSDRTRPTLIIADEAYQFLQDAPAFEVVFEEGYRRARKYRGSIGVITQDVLDIENFGRVGKVIYTNSAFRFFLEGTNLELAKKRNLIDIDDFTVNLGKSVRYNAPKYSEVLLVTDNFGSGVVRLIVDPYSYYVYTSNPSDIAAIERLVKEGLSYDEAIEKLIREKEEKKAGKK